MKISELMQDFAPNPAYEGLVQAEDYVLAIGMEDGAEIKDYLVAQEGITEHSGSLNPTTSEKRYMRTGSNTAKTGTKRQFAVKGDVFVGDPFLDALLSHKMKYGTGKAVMKDYVYFNLLTGKGEKGTISIMVEDDPSGAAGDDAGFTANLYTRGTPQEYTYTATETPPEG